MRAIASGRGLDGLVEPDNGPGLTDHAGLLAAIEGQDPRAVRAFVEDVIAIAGISRVGGRSAGEIAERFLARAANPSGALPEEMRAVLRRYLAIAGDPDAAAAVARTLARDAGLDLAAALDAFEERTGFMAARGLDVSGFRFRCRFRPQPRLLHGFHLRDPRRAARRTVTLVVGGGRYDRLLQHLGAPEPIPAVGCSIWLDRVDPGAAP